MDYEAVNKEVKKSVGRDKKKYMEDLAQETEEEFYLRGYRRRLMKNM